MAAREYQLHVKMHQNERSALLLLAKFNGMPASALVRMLVREEVKRQGLSRRGHR
jgi:hypothetical protein